MNQYGSNFIARLADHLIAQHIFRFQKNHIYNHKGKKTIISLITGPIKHVWLHALSNKLVRLDQGNNHGVQSTYTINFIFRYKVPNDRSVTYVSFVCDYKPLKSEPYYVRFVSGGDKINYPDNIGSPAASLIETKLLLNSTIYDAKKGSQFMSCDPKDLLLASPVEQAEYMRINMKHSPPDIIQRYNIHEKVAIYGYVYIKIK